MIGIIAPRLTKIAQEADDMGLDEDLSSLAPKRHAPPKRPDSDNVLMADDEDLDVAPNPIGGPGDGLPATGPDLTPVPPPPPPADEPEPAVDPGVEHEEYEAEEPVDPTENMNVRGKIWYAMENNLPLRIIYTALESGLVTERSVAPIEVYWAGTHRHIMVAWCYLRNDWRAFAIDRISEAEIEKDDK